MAPAVSLVDLAAAGTGQSFVPLSASNSLLRLRFGPERAGAGRDRVLRAVFQQVTGVDLSDPASDVAILDARGAALLARAETLFLATTAVVAAGAAPDPHDPAATALLARVVQVHHSTATTAGA